MRRASARTSPPRWERGLPTVLYSVVGCRNGQVPIDVFDPVVGKGTRNRLDHEAAPLEHAAEWGFGVAQSAPCANPMRRGYTWSGRRCTAVSVC